MDFTAWSFGHKISENEYTVQHPVSHLTQIVLCCFPSFCGVIIFSYRHKQAVYLGTILCMGLTNMHTPGGFSVLYNVFTRKQCILCSALCHKKYLTLYYLMLHWFEIHSALELLCKALLGCRLTASHPRKPACWQ